jgi:hypothetical protein
MYSSPQYDEKQTSSKFKRDICIPFLAKSSETVFEEKWKICLSMLQHRVTVVMCRSKGIARYLLLFNCFLEAMEVWLFQLNVWQLTRTWILIHAANLEMRDSDPEGTLEEDRKASEGFLNWSVLQLEGYVMNQYLPRDQHNGKHAKT